MIVRIKILLCALALSLLVSCSGSDKYSVREGLSEDAEILQVKDYKFSEDYKTLTIRVLNTGKYNVEDWDILDLDISVSELSDKNHTFGNKAQPELVEVRHSGIDELCQYGIGMQLLVDLSLKQEAVDREREFVRSLSKSFQEGQLKARFMDGGGVSELYDVTDYLTDNYFVSTRVEKGKNKLLYKGIQSLLSTSGQIDRTIYLVLSDGRTYEDGKPIDPEHFARQEQLSKMVESMRLSNILCCLTLNDGIEPDDAKDFVTSLCERSGGSFIRMEKWNGKRIQLMEQYAINYADYSLVLEYPDNKVFNGKKYLDIEYRNDTTLIAHNRISYRVGTFYRPVIVHGRPQGQIVAVGTITLIWILVLAMLIGQLLLPKLRYSRFCRKYVTRYERDNMSVDGMLIDKNCYYCKAPFVPGDEIVVKCKHVMHRHCWNENGYHCPEYGRHCPDGSHYYNPSDILDPENADYHLRWVTVAIFAAYFSWLAFTLHNQESLEQMMVWMTSAIDDVHLDQSNMQAFSDIVYGNMNQIPSMGMWIGLIFTFSISLLGMHRRKTSEFVVEILMRTLIGGFLGMAAFTLSGLASILLDMGIQSYLIDWIPWVLTGASVILVSTYGTRVKPCRRWFLMTLVIGVVSMLCWSFAFVLLGMDYRVWILGSITLFTIGLSFTIAKPIARSERYFLHIAGSIKEMDLALYKWFSANSNRIIRVGRSVDCDIVMSWDIQSDIAPVQAELGMRHGRVYVKPIEDGVWIGSRALAVGKTYRLYHGNTMSIGKTTFTFVEKDT